MTTTEQFLASAFPGSRLVSREPLAGGHSGHTLRAVLENAPVEQLVVKAGAPGRPPVGRHDVLRQARLFEVLVGVDGVRVPTVLAVDDGDPNQFAMSFAKGDSTEPVLDGVGDLTPEVVEARARAAARMLGVLHSLPVDGGVTARLGGVVPARLDDELDRWEKTLRVVDQTLTAGWEDLLARLRAERPTSERVAIVHGDYRLGNLLCDGEQVMAIIDWEIWNIADPRVDLGWTLLFCDPAYYPGVGKPAPGMPSMSDLLAEYESVGGPVHDIGWFLGFGCFKTAAIMSHNLKRHREGRYHDPYQEELPPTIREMVRRGRDHLGDRSLV
jgi:aminoglycoside phosphotransferase (APT) family kinase protein